MVQLAERAPRAPATRSPSTASSTCRLAPRSSRAACCAPARRAGEFVRPRRGGDAARGPRGLARAEARRDRARRLRRARLRLHLRAAPTLRARFRWWAEPAARAPLAADERGAPTAPPLAPAFSLAAGGRLGAPALARRSCASARCCRRAACGSTCTRPTSSTRATCSRSSGCSARNGSGGTRSPTASSPAPDRGAARRAQPSRGLAVNSAGSNGFDRRAAPA